MFNPGDKVLVCSNSGEVFGIGEVNYIADQYYNVNGLGWDNRLYSIKTNKLRGDDLYLHPYDEQKAEEFNRRVEEAQRNSEQRKQNYRKETINYIADNIVVGSYNKKLEVLNDDELEKLKRMIKKLGGA